MNSLDLLLSFLFTWSIGLALPTAVRFLVYRRPLMKSEALAWAVSLGFAELVLFVALGSQSKTHFVLFLIGWVAYRILQSKRGKLDRLKQSAESNANPVACREGVATAQESVSSERRLDTPWKRAAFVPLVLAIILLLGLIVVPLPVRIETDEWWIEGAAPNQKTRTVQRLSYACAQSDLGYPSFGSELEILSASSNIYYALLIEEDKTPRALPESLDIDQELLNQLREGLAKQGPVCFQRKCIQVMTPQLLEGIIQSCSKPTTQSLKVERRLRLDLSHLNGRENLLLAAILTIFVSSLFSVFYSATVGRLVRWVRNG